MCASLEIKYLWGRNVCLNKDFNILWLAQVWWDLLSKPLFLLFTFMLFKGYSHWL